MESGKNGEGQQVEMVTPILHYEDIETLQELIRRIRKAGAKTNSSCGIHIHVGADQHTARSLRNLVNIFTSKQDMYRFKHTFCTRLLLSGCTPQTVQALKGDSTLNVIMRIYNGIKSKDVIEITRDNVNGIFGAA